MRYQNNSFDVRWIGNNIQSYDALLIELTNLADDDNKKSDLIDALTIKRITNLYENVGQSFSSDHALRWSHEESRRNLIKLLNLFPKDKRIALIAGSYCGETTLLSADPDHEVYLKDFTRKVFLEDGWYNDVANIQPDFVWTWESFIKNLAMYVKSNIHALHDVLSFIPEDSIALFFKEIGVEKLLTVDDLDSLLQKYDFLEPLFLNEINNQISKLEDVPGILKKISPNCLKKFYNKLSEKIPRLAYDINAFAYVLGCFPDSQFSASTIAALKKSAPKEMGVDTLINDHNKLIQVVFNLNPKLRLRFLKNLGVINYINTSTTPEKRDLKNMLFQLLSSDWHGERRSQRCELDFLTSRVVSRTTTKDASLYGKHPILDGAMGFEAYLKSKNLDVTRSDNWKDNVETCRVWIPSLLQDCFLRPAWNNDQEFCQRINESAINKLKLLAETGRYPEAELAMIIVSLAANKPVEADRWLEKFKAWNTWFAWQEYKNNRVAMKGLTVVCQELSKNTDFEFNCPTWITDDRQKEIFISLVNTMKTLLNKMSDADKQRIMDYFKSPAFNFLKDTDMTKYRAAVIVQQSFKLPLSAPKDDCTHSCVTPVLPPAYATLFPKNLDNLDPEDTLRVGPLGGRASFFGGLTDMQLVASLQVPSHSLAVLGVEIDDSDIQEAELINENDVLSPMQI